MARSALLPVDRPPPRRWRPWTRRAACFLIVGVVVNVLVAWVFAQRWTYARGRAHTWETLLDRQVWPVGVPADWPAEQGVFTGRCTGSCAFYQELSVSSGPATNRLGEPVLSYAISVEQSGFPLPALQAVTMAYEIRDPPPRPSPPPRPIAEGEVVPQMAICGGVFGPMTVIRMDAVSRLNHGVQVRWLPTARLEQVALLPLMPMGPGFAINSVFYAGLFGGAFLTVGHVRRWRRVRAGRCPACGYSRSGLGSGALCPECGFGAQQARLG